LFSRRNGAILACFRVARVCQRQLNFLVVYMLAASGFCGWPALLTFGFSGNPALLLFVLNSVIAVHFESNKYFFFFFFLGDAGIYTSLTYLLTYLITSVVTD